MSQALKIGDNNVIESKGEMFVLKERMEHLDEWSHSLSKCPLFGCLADVGRNVILTSGCIIGAFCQVNTCEVIPENTVIYGSGCMRRVQTERPQVRGYAHWQHFGCKWVLRVKYHSSQEEKNWQIKDFSRWCVTSRQNNVLNQLSELQKAQKGEQFSNTTVKKKQKKNMISVDK